MPQVDDTAWKTGGFCPPAAHASCPEVCIASPDLSCLLRPQGEAPGRRLAAVSVGSRFYREDGPDAQSGPFLQLVSGKGIQFLSTQANQNKTRALFGPMEIHWASEMLRIAGTSGADLG